MNNIDFLKVENLSDEEMRKMYEQLPKERLIEMLISCNKALNNIYDLSVKPAQIYPNQSINWKDYYNCSDWAHCSNPHRDCINCPLMSASPYLTTHSGSSDSDIKTNFNK